MGRSKKLPAVLAFAAACVACSTARDPARGFRLAGNGDIRRGQTAFQEFACTTCHEVAGANLPVPAIQPVRLGGPVIHEPSDGYLVTAIINPRYHAERHAGADATGRRMPEFADRMTVQQLTDIVAYLQSRYTLGSATPTEFP